MSVYVLLAEFVYLTRPPNKLLIKHLRSGYFKF